MYETCINVYVSIAVCMFVDANKCLIECMNVYLLYWIMYWGRKLKVAL